MRALVCFFSAVTVSATPSRYLSQVLCRSTISGLISRAIARTLSLIARQLGTPATSVLSAGRHELDVNCAIPKARLSCALRRPGSNAPAVESPQTNTRGRRFRSTQLAANEASWLRASQHSLNHHFADIVGPIALSRIS